MTDQATIDQLPEDLRNVSQAGLVVMYYDEIIGALRAATSAIENGNVEARFNAVASATELLANLYTALDRENGGEMATNLARIYNLVLTRLPRINLDNDAGVAAHAIDLLEPLRASWAELDRRITAGEISEVALAPAFPGGQPEFEAPRANAA